MTETAKAKLIQQGRRQVVLFPKEFRIPWKEVQVRGIGSSILLEPEDAGEDRETAERSEQTPATHDGE